MIEGEQFDLTIPDALNHGAFLLDHNLEEGRGDKDALYHGDDTYTFDQLWRLTNRVGNILRDLGVEPENRVLLVLGDSPAWVASWIATMKIGGVGTHAYTYLNAPDYAYLLDLVRPKVVVVDGATLAKLRKANEIQRAPKILLVAGEITDDLRDGEFSLNAMLDGAKDELTIEPTHSDDLAFWNFSSGTTGKPKGVPHTHRDGFVAYMSANTILEYRADDIVLRVPKLFFHYSRDHLLFSLRNGAASVVFEDRTTVEGTFDLIAKHKPTVLVNVPTMMRAMIQTPKEARADLSSVRRIMSSGEPLTAPLYAEWLEEFGVEAVNRFGSAEACLGYLSNVSGTVMPGSSGKVAPLVKLRLVDDAGNDVAQGEPGRMLVHSQSSGMYYEREYKKSLETFLGDGWVNTGDIFTQDEQDYFWYVSRADDMVKVSGVWIAPMEIERGLQTSPDVLEAAVLGVDDADGLKRLKAFVVLNNGLDESDETADALKQYCKRSLAPHKFPTTIEFMAELPKSGQGKIDRRALREGAGGA
ncbi:MAG: benzoate-CoA ligase family protein [Rhodospirillales bacterium]|nr:benzoate-CoA ligase family protein [Rhodospirillales bacterium]